MDGMPRAWSVPLETPCTGAPLKAVFKERPRRLFPNRCPFRGSSKLLCWGLAHRGPGNKALGRKQ